MSAASPQITTQPIPLVQPVKSQPQKADGFQALLDVGVQAPEPSRPQEAKASSSTRPEPKTRSEQPEARSGQPARPPRPETKARPEQAQERSPADTSARSGQEETAAAQNGQEVAAPADSQSEEAQKAGQSLRAKIKEALERIGQLLLAPAAPVALPQPPAVQASVPVATAQPAPALTPQMQETLAAIEESLSLIAQAIAPALPDSPPGAILRPVGEIPTVPADLAAKLQQQVARLTQLLAPDARPGASARPAVPVPQILTAQPVDYQSAEPQPVVPTFIPPAPEAVVKDTLAILAAQLEQTISKQPAHAPVETPVVSPEYTIEGAIAKVMFANKSNSFMVSAQAEPVGVSAAAQTAAAPAAEAVTASPVAPAAGAESHTESDAGNGSAPGQNVPQAGSASAQGAVESADSASFSETLGQTRRPGLTEQVAVQIKTAMADGSSKIHIRLDPAELGALDIKLDVGKDGKTTILVTADHKSTLDLLQRDAQGLTRALADVGLSAEGGSLSFNLRGGQDEGQGGNSHPQASQQYQKAQPDEEPLGLSVLTRSYVVNLSEGLDIKI